jgi:hypothetical protein
MNLLDTIDYFINDMKSELESISWQIREETNYEDNIIDDLSEQYDFIQDHLNNLNKIRSIVYSDPLQMILDDPDDSLNDKIAVAMQQASQHYDS